MSKKLFVGNLPHSTTENELKELFASHGEVSSAQVIIDRDSGRSKGFGFVEMSSDDAAQSAINALNGFELQGRQLTVNEARPREERPRQFRDDRGGGGGGRERRRSF